MSNGFRVVCPVCGAKEFVYSERHLASAVKVGHHERHEMRRPYCAGVYEKETT